MTNQNIKKQPIYTVHYDLDNGLYMTVDILTGSNNQKEIYTIRDTARQGILLVAFAHRTDECTYIDHLYCEQEGLLKTFVLYLLEYNMHVASLVAIREDLLDAQTKDFYDFFEMYYIKDDGYLFLDVFKCYGDEVSDDFAFFDDDAAPKN